MFCSKIFVLKVEKCTVVLHLVSMILFILKTIGTHLNDTNYHCYDSFPFKTYIYLESSIHEFFSFIEI